MSEKSTLKTARSSWAAVTRSAVTLTPAAALETSFRLLDGSITAHDQEVQNEYAKRKSDCWTGNKVHEISLKADPLVLSPFSSGVMIGQLGRPLHLPGAAAFSLQPPRPSGLTAHLRPFSCAADRPHWHTLRRPLTRCHKSIYIIPVGKGRIPDGPHLNNAHRFPAIIILAWGAHRSPSW